MGVCSTHVGIFDLEHVRKWCFSVVCVYVVLAFPHQTRWSRNASWQGPNDNVWQKYTRMTRYSCMTEFRGQNTLAISAQGICHAPNRMRTGTNNPVQLIRQRIGVMDRLSQTAEIHHLETGWCALTSYE